MDSLHTFTKNTLRPLITSVCRDVVSTILNKIDKGELRLINEDQKLTKDSVSSEIIFGSGNPTAVVYVKDEWFWVRTIFSGSLVANPFF
jgi:hypothetical protein